MILDGKTLAKENEERLKKEIDDVADKIDTNSNIVNTIYIGGGTPSYNDEKYIAEILEKIKKLVYN